MPRSSAASMYGLLLLAMLSVPGPASSQGNPPGKVTGNFYALGGGLPTSSFDAGGDASQVTLVAGAGVTRQITRPFSIGLSARYETQAWQFGEPVRFGSAAPWERLHRPSVTLNLGLALSPTIVTRVAPTLEWAYDGAAGPEDALLYGVVVSGAKVFSPRFVLGAGASVARQLYSVKTTPFVIVNWKISDRWRLANASASSPLGGAGVEIRHETTPEWEFALGGVVRGDRWRIHDSAVAGATVAETSSMPLRVRATRKFGERTQVDLHAGVYAGAKITLRDDSGRDLGHDGYTPAPLLALSFSTRF